MHEPALPDPAARSRTHDRTPLTNEAIKAALRRFDVQDPSSLIGGYISAANLTTHGFGIGRGLYLLSHLGSDDFHTSEVPRNLHVVREFVEAGFAEAESLSHPRVMSIAIRECLRDFVALAHLYGVDLHEAVDDAIAAESSDFGLPDRID